MRKGFFMRLALTNIRKNRKIYYPYILTAIITTAMLYIISSLSANPNLTFDTLALTLVLGLVVTSLFSIVFLFYTNSFLMKRRKKEFGLFNILGMEKKHISRVVGWETLFILLISLLCGFAFGIVLDKLMFMLLTKIVATTALPTFYVSTYGIAVTLLIIGGTFVLIYLNSLRQIHLSKPIELLHGGNVGEREPKARWLITLLGVLTLGAGYWLSITCKDAVMSIFLFFIAVLFVIAGTYLLFTSVSVTVMKLLKKNKRYFYSADHFISLSGMIYRMKRNAIGLANICILSTMVLVMVFATTSLWIGIEDVIGGRIARDISVELRSYEDVDEANAIIDDVLAKEGLERLDETTSTTLSFAAYLQGDTFSTDPGSMELSEALNSDRLYSLILMPLEEYNRSQGLHETLGEDEILLSSYLGNYPEDTVNLLGSSFHIKKRMEPAQFSSNVGVEVYNTQLLVVNSWDTFLHLTEEQNAAYGKHASSIRKLIEFNVDADDKQQLRLYSLLRKSIYESDLSASIESRAQMRIDFKRLYGGLLFVGLFLSALFLMAMILIMYYKQISEGYDDSERYRIMRKVGLSRAEIKRSINSQLMMVFFMPLLVAGIHIAFAFPCLTVMFRTLYMTNVMLMACCALASFALFAIIYGMLYLLTARVYYRIVSE